MNCSFIIFWPIAVPVGNASKAKKKLGWDPKMKFKQLSEIMTDVETAQLLKEMEGRHIRI